jgi:predicted nucleic acid-binding protein
MVSKMHIVDTYAWIEYFIGSDKGEKAAVIIDDPTEHLITVECYLAEIRGWTLREKQIFDEIYAIVKSNSEILRVFTRMWIRAAEVRHEVRKIVSGFGLIDSVILAVQEDKRCMVLTGDPHFKEMNDVVFLE